jgi:hypothetical protein
LLSTLSQNLEAANQPPTQQTSQKDEIYENLRKRFGGMLPPDVKEALDREFDENSEKDEFFLGEK